MSARRSFWEGALKLSCGQTAVQLCSFTRSVILARLISPENFGIAATFGLTYAFIEMFSNLSTQTLLIQAPDGDDARLQNTGHLLLVGRGIISSAVLLA